MAEAPLFQTEAEIAKRLGVPPKQWEATAIVLEREGLPRRDPVFGERRYWPAVKAFLDRRAGLEDDRTDGDAPRGWSENFDDEPRTRRTRRAGTG